MPYRRKHFLNNICFPISRATLPPTEQAKAKNAHLTSGHFCHSFPPLSLVPFGHYSRIKNILHGTCIEILNSGTLGKFCTTHTQNCPFAPKRLHLRVCTSRCVSLSFGESVLHLPPPTPFPYTSAGTPAPSYPPTHLFLRIVYNYLLHSRSRSNGSKQQGQRSYRVVPLLQPRLLRLAMFATFCCGSLSQCAPPSYRVLFFS